MTPTLCLMMAGFNRNHQRGWKANKKITLGQDLKLITLVFIIAGACTGQGFLQRVLMGIPGV